MGRKSRKKPERREKVSNSPVSSALNGLNFESIFPLLEALSVSPQWSWRTASTAAIYNAAVKLRKRSLRGRVASPADIPALLDSVDDQHGQVLFGLEDFQPHDARLSVQLRWRNELYRIIPGALEQPIAIINQHARLVETIDPYLVGQLGFGLGDVLELMLRRLDSVAAALAPHWEEEAAGDETATPTPISVEEIRAARLLPSLGRRDRFAAKKHRTIMSQTRHPMLIKTCKSIGGFINFIS